jgi:hypothetical protein
MDQKVFILKHAHNNCLFLSTQVDGHKAPVVVGFSSKAKAQTIRTLMYNKVKVESFELQRISRLCNAGNLDFILFKDKGESETFRAPSPIIDNKIDIDHARFMLENTFRYQ